MIQWYEPNPEKEDTYLITWYGYLKDGTRKGPYVELTEYYPGECPYEGEWDLKFLKDRGWKDVEVEAWAEIEPYRGE